jgi:hypothetical protein
MTQIFPAVFRWRISVELFAALRWSEGFGGPFGPPSVLFLHLDFGAQKNVKRKMQQKHADS